MYDGTLASDWKALVTFQQMIVLCDQDGVVDVTPEALHRRTGIPLDIITDGIDALEQPDPRSRTPDCDGCRIIRIDDFRDWGWQIVNHEKYKKLVNTEETRRKTRERVQNHRVTRCNAVKRDVTPGTECNDIQIQIQMEDTNETVSIAAQSHPKSEVRRGGDVTFDAFWSVVHRRVGKQAAKAAFSRAIDRVRKEHACTAAIAAGRIQAAMEEFAASPQASDEVKGNLHPATWLNEGRYDDDREAWQTTNSQPKPETDEERHAKWLEDTK